MDGIKGSVSVDKAVLIIEDDESVSEVLSLSISYLTSFQALRAMNARDALVMVHTLHPDLVVIDYGLPDTNGLELYKMLQEREHLRGIPVLLMSANLPEHVKDTLPMPFLEKPFSMEIFVETITHLLAP